MELIAKEVLHVFTLTVLQQYLMQLDVAHYSRWEAQ